MYADIAAALPIAYAAGDREQETHYQPLLKAWVKNSLRFRCVLTPIKPQAGRFPAV